MVAIDSSAVLGSQVCVFTTVTPATPDANPTNDTMTRCFTISNSWDPNHKDVYPTAIPQAGDWLTYTIEFQNTGTDTTYLVVVRDTLSPYVDASSFQYIASSHKAVVQLFGNAMVFTFPKINLVDSATNAPLSEGWIQYKVKTNTNLTPQSQITNTAYIYFDINPAVVTNTTTTMLDTAATGPSGISHISDAGSIWLYPNPNKGSFTLQTSNATHSDYIITDMLGHVIMQQTITADRQAIDMASAAAGVYTLSVKGASASRQLRFTVVR